MNSGFLNGHSTVFVVALVIDTTKLMLFFVRLVSHLLSKIPAFTKATSVIPLTPLQVFCRPRSPSAYMLTTLSTSLRIPR